VVVIRVATADQLLAKSELILLSITILNLHRGFIELKIRKAKNQIVHHD